MLVTIIDILFYAHIAITNITFCIAELRFHSPKKSNQLLVWFAETSSIWIYFGLCEISTFHTNMLLFGWLLFIWLYTIKKTSTIPFIGEIQPNQVKYTVRSWWKTVILVLIVSNIQYGNICLSIFWLLCTGLLWWYTLHRPTIYLHINIKFQDMSTHA